MISHTWSITCKWYRLLLSKSRNKFIFETWSIAIMKPSIAECSFHNWSQTWKMIIHRKYSHSFGNYRHIFVALKKYVYIANLFSCHNLISYIFVSICYFSWMTSSSGQLIQMRVYLWGPCGAFPCKWLIWMALCVFTVSGQILTSKKMSYITSSHRVFTQNLAHDR